MVEFQRSLVQQLRITDTELADRKALLNFTPQHEELLAAVRTSAAAAAAGIVEDFYARQFEIPEIRAIIGDRDTFNRLSGAMPAYIIRLFAGNYDLDYANARLRIGQVHARIGVPPRLYVGSLHTLEELIAERLAIRDGDCREALRKLFLLDLEFAFDAYVFGLVSRAELAHANMARYSESLEDIIATRTAQARRLAETDALSGLRSRSSFDAELQREWETASASASHFSVAFFDIDKFKDLNDTHGHVAGDRAIQAVAAAIRKSIRERDKAFRVGGDEFCILLPGASLQDATAVCDRISTKCREDEDQPIQVTYGVASLMELGFGASPRTLYDAADRKLYEARQPLQ